VTFEVEGALPDPTGAIARNAANGRDIFLRRPRSARGRDHPWRRPGDLVSVVRKVRRGFCSTCGSSLFWDPIHKDWIGIAMGRICAPTDTKLRIHVHVASKGDYYDIADGVPQHQP